MTEDNKKTLHLVGVGVKHSIAPPMHNLVAESLGLPWTFYSTECPTIDDLMKLAREPSTAGLVVTMPYKNTVMDKLDRLDELATTIGACNNVYRDSKDPSILVGTNTDWLGIKGCLLEKGDESRRPKEGNTSTPALLVGAGGASRAAVYALSAHLHSPNIYVLNRDDAEVEQLIRDTRKIEPAPVITHIKTVEQAAGLASPYYIVGTVPDFAPQSESELAVAAILEHFLARSSGSNVTKPSSSPGVLLDMCFKPRRTRMIKQSERYGWPTVEGTHVIGYQVERQWKLWTGKEDNAIDLDAAWAGLLKAAEESTAIN
ncbi:hypothetical protein BX600DRAFT_382038 [Xylariales sp. PMI_506]|nr:hypothetical protein BX600DRAFT_382038 [Xylariales sp. PMI_506]